MKENIYKVLPRLQPPKKSCPWQLYKKYLKYWPITHWLGSFPPRPSLGQYLQQQHQWWWGSHQWAPSSHPEHPCSSPSRSVTGSHIRGWLDALLG